MSTMMRYGSARVNTAASTVAERSATNRMRFSSPTILASNMIGRRVDSPASPSAIASGVPWATADGTQPLAPKARRNAAPMASRHAVPEFIAWFRAPDFSGFGHPAPRDAASTAPP